MPSLKSLRTRIASVKATQKITKAMQMVAAAKLRRAQMAAEAARPYASRMQRVLTNLSAGVPSSSAPPLLAGTGSDARHLLIVCTAERGLCGAFNSSIARLARDRANALMSEGKSVKLICVGKKGYDILKRLFEKDILEVVELRGVKQIGFGNAQAVADKVIARFANGEFDVATLFYARFRSVIQQIPTAQRIIPADTSPGEGEPETGAPGFYEFEPDEGEILTSLLPRNIAVQIYRALLENVASEMGAKMSAMDSATRNAGEMIRKQTIFYNRTRQAMITKELIEIISGAEAL
ncbi:MAG: F0F1 ATP synthase subunit gamma [Hyphomicrobiales bacterium]|nr:F0F1 ATP synthase subunit gamma [Hyphomicrobiales bacterium]